MLAFTSLAVRRNPEIPKSQNPEIPKSLASRHGLTLVELLVVVSIMMILVGFAIPRLRPASEQRRLREAARMVNVYLNRARARAVETGRPCGVRFAPIENPVNGETSASNLLYQVEVPPPYAGNTVGASIRVQDFTFDPNWDGTSGSSQFPDANKGYYSPSHIVLKASLRVGDLGDGLIKYGDPIQIDHKGAYYEIWFDPYSGGSGSIGGVPFNVDEEGYIIFSEGLDNDGDGWIDNRWLTLRRKAPPRSQSPWPKWDGVTYWSGQIDGKYFSSPKSFTILREPAPTIAQPLKLPRGTVVDLSASGLNQLGLYSTITDFSGIGDQQPVTVMFSPNGSVERCYYNNGTAQCLVPAEPVFFLVGREKQVGQDAATSLDTPDEEMPNWQLLDSHWVVISPQVGLIAVAENAVPTQYFELYGTAQEMTEPEGIDEARTFAKQSHSKGGR